METTKATNVITKLYIENFKRIKVVQIEPSGNLIHITGRNAQGKSCTLEAFAVAMGGKAEECAEPIRVGEDHARIVVETPELIIKWVKFRGKRSSLVVRANDGDPHSKPLGSPMKLLREHYGSLSFRPMEFMRHDAKKQLETVRELAGLDFTDIDTRRDQLYEMRTQAGRELKQYEGRIALHDGATYPDEKISVRDLMEKRRDANGVLRSIADLEQKLDTNQKLISSCEIRITELKLEIKAKTDEIVSISNECRETTISLSEIEPPDLDAIEKQIEESESTNAEYEKGRTLAADIKERNTIKSHFDGFTKDIKELDEKKAAIIADSTMPVDGLDFNEDGLTYNGLPLDQASQSEQIRISAAIGLALSGKKLLLIKDGSLLDPESMQALNDFAVEQDAQIFIEEVSDGSDIGGIIIEDGMILDNSSQEVA